MRLTQLAQELGRDPAEVLEVLLRCPVPIFTEDRAADIYGIKIASHLVEAAREYFLHNAAQEVIDHVKEYGTEGVKEKGFRSDPNWDDGEDD